MVVGLRPLLLIIAVVLFVLAGIDDNFDLLSIGLACFAGSLLAGEMGWDRRFGVRREKRGRLRGP